jgi:hypothetical protein
MPGQPWRDAPGGLTLTVGLTPNWRTALAAALEKIRAIG